MQAMQEEPFKVPNTPRFLVEVFNFLRRYRKHPEALEPFLDSMRAIGVPETNVANVRMIAISYRDVALDRMAMYRLDRNGLKAILVLDALLLPVVLVLGVSDLPLILAAVLLVLSLVALALSWCIAFIQREAGVTGYGKVHSNIVVVAQTSGVLSLTAVFWHSSTLLGVLFLVQAVLAVLLFASYAMLLKTVVGVIRLQHAVTDPAAHANADTSATSATNALGEPATSAPPRAQDNGRGVQVDGFGHQGPHYPPGVANPS